MLKLILALLAAVTLSCQTDDSADGNAEAWDEHLQNAGRARKAKQLERAEIELSAALRLLEKSPARLTHTRVLAALGVLKGEKQEFAAAGSLFEASINIQLTELGIEGLVSEHLVNDMVQLAMVRNLQENPAAAESLLTRVLTFREQGDISLDPIEPNCYQVFGMMARFVRERGLTQRADSLQALSETYEQYARGFNAQVKGEYSTAQEHYQKALSSGEKVLGTHLDIARFCRDLSLALTMQAKHDQAVAMLTRAVAIFEQLDEPTALAVALGDLADGLDRLNRTTEAEATRERLASLRTAR